MNIAPKLTLSLPKSFFSKSIIAINMSNTLLLWLLCTTSVIL